MPERSRALLLCGKNQQRCSNDSAFYSRDNVSPSAFRESCTTVTCASQHVYSLSSVATETSPSKDLPASVASASSSLGSTAIRGPGAPAVPSGSPAGTVASKVRAGSWGGRGSGRPLSCFLLRKACWLRRAQASVRTAPSGLGSLFIVFKNQSRK